MEEALGVVIASLLARCRRPCRSVARSEDRNRKKWKNETRSNMHVAEMHGLAVRAGMVTPPLSQQGGSEPRGRIQEAYCIHTAAAGQTK